jgi:hypothetical protein
VVTGNAVMTRIQKVVRKIVPVAVVMVFVLDMKMKFLAKRTAKQYVEILIVQFQKILLHVLKIVSNFVVIPIVHMTKI